MLLFGLFLTLAIYAQSADQGHQNLGGAITAFLIIVSFLLSCERVCFDSGRRSRWVWGIFIPIFGLPFGLWRHARLQQEKEKKLKAKENKRLALQRMEEEHQRAKEAEQNFQQMKIKEQILTIKRHLEEMKRHLASPEGQREALLNDLVDISGVSEKKARTLLDQFPTRASIQGSTIEDLSDIPGIGESLAKAISARL